MSDFGALGGVKVLGFISPLDTTDNYPVIEPLLGIDGLRNYSGDTDSLSGITVERRRPGMIVGINNGADYYKLKAEPWDLTMNDWENFFPTSLYIYTTGSTLTDKTLSFNRTDTASAYTVSLDTLAYQSDLESHSGDTNNPHSVTPTQLGIYTSGETDNLLNEKFDKSGGTISGLTTFVTGLSADSVSATTYYNLPKGLSDLGFYVKPNIINQNVVLPGDSQVTCFSPLNMGFGYTLIIPLNTTLNVI